VAVNDSDPVFNMRSREWTIPIKGVSELGRSLKNIGKLIATFIVMLPGVACGATNIASAHLKDVYVHNATTTSDSADDYDVQFILEMPVWMSEKEIPREGLTLDSWVCGSKNLGTAALRPEFKFANSRMVSGNANLGRLTFVRTRPDGFGEASNLSKEVAAHGLCFQLRGRTSSGFGLMTNVVRVIVRR
jgi:hypothetical protein